MGELAGSAAGAPAFEIEVIHYPWLLQTAAACLQHVQVAAVEVAGRQAKHAMGELRAGRQAGRQLGHSEALIDC